VVHDTRCACSLGNAAVFLIGGNSRDVDPVPILLRSGDVVIMSGPACRRAYHGIPQWAILVVCLLLIDISSRRTTDIGKYPSEPPQVLSEWKCGRRLGALRELS